MSPVDRSLFCMGRDGDRVPAGGIPRCARLLVEAGLGADLSAALVLNIAYTGEFGGGTRQHGLRVDLALVF